MPRRLPKRRNTTNPAKWGKADLTEWARNLKPHERSAEIQRLATELFSLRTHHDQVLVHYHATGDKEARKRAISIGATMRQLQRHLDALQSAQ